MDETNEWIAAALQDIGERVARVERDMMFFEGQRMLLLAMMIQALVKSGAADRDEAIATLVLLLEGVQQMAEVEGASPEPVFFVDQLSRLLVNLRKF
jgi:hypothetical protein